jgi:hypothetical protein
MGRIVLFIVLSLTSWVVGADTLQAVYTISVYQGTSKVDEATAGTQDGAWSACLTKIAALQATTVAQVSCKEPVLTLTSVSTLPPLGGCPDAVVYEDAVGPGWLNDYSWGSPTINYADTTGAPFGTADIKFQDAGGYQPAGTTWAANVQGCNYLTFALKPTIANAKYHGQFLYVGDVATGIIIDYTGGQYGPANPVVGQWNIYKVPLSAFFPNGAVPSTVYKFNIQTMQDAYSGYPNGDLFYLDHVGFTAQ